ncbi:MAG TPA: Nramp family divalent metal transporter, partial [Propionibacteriaceae bacterium]|nr:Nramp family divalent metal transporter [Propionibacteriaceae bacterium]
GGMRPRFEGAESRALAAAMLGATVMPHAIYLHSALARDRHRPHGVLTRPIAQLLRVQRVDVLASLALAGSVNIAMLLFAASALRADAPPDSIIGAHQVIGESVGALPALLFGFGLLASGVGSSVVGTHAGAGIMKDLLPIPVPYQVRRIVVIVPAIALLMAGIDPTEALVFSQLILSFGIAFAIVPLAWLTGNRALMGQWVNPVWLRVVSWMLAATIVALNLWLLFG